MDAGDLLRMMLPLAVPQRIMDFKQLSWDQIQEIATTASQYMAEHGDDVLFKSRKKGDTAKAFNMLAKGIAALSFAPGGVNLFGMHFETIHPESLERGRWLYHPILADALPEIARNGLVPDQSGKVFFMGTERQAGARARNMFAELLKKGGGSWDPVLLRVHSAHLGDVEVEKSWGDEFSLNRAVSAVFTQVWVPQKEVWTEVREAVDQGYANELWTKYGTPGKIDVVPDASPLTYGSKYIEQFWPKE